MNTIAGKWAGRIYGTNTGNLFLEIDQEGDKLTGVVRVLDDMSGLVIYDLVGESNDRICFTCNPKKSPEGIEISKTTAVAELRPDGSLMGEWESDIGTAGTFEAFPHIYEKRPTQVGGQVSIPGQIYSHTIPFGSARLYDLNVSNLFDNIKRDFIQGRLIVTYKLRGSEVTRYAEDFLRDSKEIAELRSLKITIQEPEAYGINKMVAVDLAEHFGSEVRVSGINESWVVGKAQSINEALASYQNRLATSYRKYGLNLNTIIFFLMLVFIPDISGWPNRLIFIGSVVVLLIILLAVHRKIIPNTIIFLSKPKAGLLKRIWPWVLSFLITAAAILVAMLIFFKLTQSP